MTFTPRPRPTTTNEPTPIQQYLELMRRRPFDAMVIEKLIAGYLADVNAGRLP